MKDKLATIFLVVVLSIVIGGVTSLAFRGVDRASEGWRYMGGGMYCRADCGARAIIHSRHGEESPLRMSAAQYQALCVRQR